MVVGTWNDEFVYIPINLVVAGRKRMDLRGKLWASVLEATGQPALKTSGLKKSSLFLRACPCVYIFFRSNHSKARFKECHADSGP